MGDSDVYVFDENSPLQQTHKDVTHYYSRPQETPTYLVQLPETLPDAAAPPNYQRHSPRTRQSTIVNMYNVPETIEEEEEPLANYIRQHLPSLRKSITPEDMQPTSRRRPSEKGDNEGSVLVMPVSAQEVEMDLKQNNAKNEKRNDANNEEPTMAEIRNEKRNVANKEEPTIAEKKHKHKQPNKKPDLHKKEITPVKTRYEQYNKKREPRISFKNEVIAMPAISDHVSVTQKSPFTNERAESKRRPSSRVKVMLMVDSSGDDTDTSPQNKKRRNLNNQRTTGNKRNSPGRNKKAENRSKPNDKKKEKSKHPEDDMGDDESIWPSDDYIKWKDDPNNKGSSAKKGLSKKDGGQTSKNKSNNRGPSSKQDHPGKDESHTSKSKPYDHENNNEPQGKPGSGKDNVRSSRNSEKNPEKQQGGKKLADSRKPGSDPINEGMKKNKRPNDDSSSSDDDGSSDDDDAYTRHSKSRGKTDPTKQGAKDKQTSGKRPNDDRSSSDDDGSSGDEDADGRQPKSQGRKDLTKHGAKNKQTSSKRPNDDRSTSDEESLDEDDGGKKSKSHGTNDPKKQGAEHNKTSNKRPDRDSSISYEESSDESNNVKQSQSRGRKDPSKQGRKHDNDRENPNMNKAPVDQRLMSDDKSLASTIVSLLDGSTQSPFREDQRNKKENHDNFDKPKKKNYPYDADDGRRNSPAAGKRPQKSGTSPYGKSPEESRKNDNSNKPGKNKDNNGSRLNNKKPNTNLGKNRGGNQDPDEPSKPLSVKAPRSASRMFYKKRYHVQIPEHKRPETWFNVRFNLDEENNVDMKYEGPVKISNYYSANKYA